MAWLFLFLISSHHSPHFADFGGALSSNSQIFTAPSLNQVNMTYLPVLWFAGPLCSSSSSLPLSLLSSFIFLPISSQKYRVPIFHLDYWVLSIPSLIKSLFIILLQRWWVLSVQHHTLLYNEPWCLTFSMIIIIAIASIY